MRSLANPRGPVRHNQTLDYDGLMREAQAAVDESPDTQAAIAQTLGVTPPVVSRALKTPGARYAALQRRIIEAVTGYTVADETTPTFRILRKA